MEAIWVSNVRKICQFGFSMQKKSILNISVLFSTSQGVYPEKISAKFLKENRLYKLFKDDKILSFPYFVSIFPEGNFADILYLIL